MTMQGNGRPRALAPVSLNAAVLHAVVSWCEALSGSSSLQAALSDLIGGLGAEAGMIVRTNLAEMRPVRIAVHDRLQDERYDRPLRLSYADSAFGKAMARSRPGTIWTSSAYAEDVTGDPALPDWQAVRRMREFAAIVLSSSGMARDHLELHFRETMSPEVEATLAAILPEMSRVWSSHRAGLVTRTIINHRSEAPSAAPETGPYPLLSSDNPARLSRAEFRVCLLLSRGLLVHAAARELALSETTIRSHLRSIYAKTDCNCLAELVFRLMDGRARPDAARAGTG